MKRDIEKRVETLEQRKNADKVPDGLGHFYALSDAERARRIAHMYGEAPNGKS